MGAAQFIAVQIGTVECVICAFVLPIRVGYACCSGQPWDAHSDSTLQFSIDFTPLVQRLAPLLQELERIEQLAAEPGGKPPSEESDQGIDQQS